MTTRAHWLALLDRIARPVLGALAAGELRRRLPVEEKTGAGRAACTHLEAVGRLRTLRPGLPVKYVKVVDPCFVVGY